MPQANEVFSAIEARHSKRSFYTNQPVNSKDLEYILTLAGNAASSKNTQPWQVAILQGKSKDSLVNLMCNKFDNNEFEEPDYLYSPEPLPPIYLERARECGFGLFKIKGIGRGDREKRKASARENYTFFEAPAALIFHLDGDSEKGTFLDMGFFMQNVMLGLQSIGISSCPQTSITAYSKTIKSHLNMPQDRIIVAGLAIGYADPEAKINSYIPERLPLKEYTKWYD